MLSARSHVSGRLASRARTRATTRRPVADWAWMQLDMGRARHGHVWTGCDLGSTSAWADEASLPVRAENRVHDMDREFSANFDRQTSVTNSFSFVGLSPPKACKTVSFFVSFHRGATLSVPCAPWLRHASVCRTEACKFAIAPTAFRMRHLLD